MTEFRMVKEALDRQQIKYRVVETMQDLFLDVIHHNGRDAVEFRFRKGEETLIDFDLDC